MKLISFFSLGILLSGVALVYADGPKPVTPAPKQTTAAKPAANNQQEQKKPAPKKATEETPVKQATSEETTTPNNGSFIPKGSFKQLSLVAGGAALASVVLNCYDAFSTKGIKTLEYPAIAQVCTDNLVRLYIAAFAFNQALK